MVVPANQDDYTALKELWSLSVRATHDLLSGDDIEYFQDRLISDYFPNVRLWEYMDGDEICGFIGLSDMIEMLFIKPSHFRQHIGTELLNFAIQKHGMTRVDVNEQNPGALKFYQAHGFKISGRDETDAEGKPYPILGQRIFPVGRGRFRHIVLTLHHETNSSFTRHPTGCADRQFRCRQI